ncbi:MAG TPA: zinc ribbon domain-containing protein [Thermomicrobiales bacterium]|nr:zinc ribbon domain-containing protein [Thermomicrobiales bacterium]
MEGTVFRVLQVLIALSGAYLAALWVVLVVWTYRDIESRSRSVVTQALSTMLSVFFFVPGTLLYMVLRPKETLDATFSRSLEEEYLLQDLEANTSCPHCNRAVEDDWIVCPHCHSKLQEPCVNCNRSFNVAWSVCPYCAHEKGQPVSTIRPLLQPIDRFVAAGNRAAISELPGSSNAIEQMESQAFYRLDTVPQPAQIPATSGRAFDRRKTREMHRARQMNGRMHEEFGTNGHGDGTGVTATDVQERDDDSA